MAPDRELVSVIIPTRNRAALVEEAIDSVMAQRDCVLEVIVVDDGSTDDTVACLAARRHQWDRLRWIAQPPRGVAAARNAGVRAAAGSWLAFLDSDDLWRPGKLAAQRALHRAAPDLLISQTNELWLRNGCRVNPCSYHRKPSGDIFLPSLARCLVSPSAVLMHRSVFESVGGFDESLPVCEDYDLWLRVASCVPVGLVSEPLVIKRGGHADQLSRRYWGMDRFRVAALVKLLAADMVSGERRRATVETLQRKCAILAHGAARRARVAEPPKDRASTRSPGLPGP